MGGYCFSLLMVTVTGKELTNFLGSRRILRRGVVSLGLKSQGFKVFFFVSHVAKYWSCIFKLRRYNFSFLAITHPFVITHSIPNKISCFLSKKNSWKEVFSIFSSFSQIWLLQPHPFPSSQQTQKVRNKRDAFMNCLLYVSDLVSIGGQLLSRLNNMIRTPRENSEFVFSLIVST